MHEGISPLPRQLPRVDTWTSCGCHVATVYPTRPDPDVDPARPLFRWWSGGDPMVVRRRSGGGNGDAGTRSEGSVRGAGGQISVRGSGRGQYKMTTLSANNSVFWGFFEKQKLTEPNFIDWYRQLRIVLSIEDKLNYLEHPLPPAPVASEGQQVAPEIMQLILAWIKIKRDSWTHAL
ncbi:hypothetical protein Tco_0359548 [Tanacetum coccineum]